LKELFSALESSIRLADTEPAGLNVTSMLLSM